MKLFTLILLFTFPIMPIWTQKVSIGIVQDSLNNAAIPDAEIINTTLNQNIHTSTDGVFTIKTNGPTTQIIISATGYESKNFIVNNSNTKDTLFFYLHKSHIQLDELIVDNGNSIVQNSTIVSVSKRKLNEISSFGESSIMQALENIPGVSQNNTGVGISKPIIRGLSGARIVTYVNGLRIENQQWGQDHGLGVTDLGIGNVEVIKGPASLLFGADALGGVLYFHDENYASPNTIEIEAKSRYESVSEGFSNAISLKQSGEKIHFNLYSSQKSYADYKTPAGNYVANSRFNEQNIKAAIGFTHNKWVSNLRYQYMQSRIGIPGHTHDSIVTTEAFLSNQSARSKNIPAQELNNHYLSFENKFYLQKQIITLNLGYTNNHLKEFEEKFTQPAINLQLSNYLFNLKTDISISPTVKLLVGSQGMWKTNRNPDSPPEIILPDMETKDIGFFGLLTKTIDKFKFQGGLRWDNRQFSIPVSTEIDTAVNNNYQGVNYALGASYKNKKSEFRLNLSSGSRAPNASELVSNGVHHGSLRYELGDKSLSSEMANQLDLSYTYNDEHFQFIVNPFYSAITNYKYLQQQDYKLDNYTVYKYQSANEANIYGGELILHYHPHFAHLLHLETSYAYLRAQFNDSQNLPLIPQNSINTKATYQVWEKNSMHSLFINLQHVFYFAQNNLALNETNTKAYQVFNLSLQYQRKGKLPFAIHGGVRNILNQAYTPHTSVLKNYAITEPGRNFYLSLIINLKKHNKK